MISDRRLRAIVDNPRVFDCFPGVEIMGGVSYFLWERTYEGDCKFSTRINGEIISSTTRDLRDGNGVVLRDNHAASVVSKVGAIMIASAEKVFGPQVPFGLRTNYKRGKSKPFSDGVPLIFGSKVEYVRRDQLERNQAWVDTWKVLLPKAYNGGQQINEDGTVRVTVIGEPIALAPGSACTQTYFVAGMFSTREETKNFALYLATKFVRFLVLQRKSTQDITPDRFRFVPMLDMKRSWSDDRLYDHFGLTQEERDYINKTIKPRSVNLSLDSPIPVSHLPDGGKYRPSSVPEELAE